MNRFASLITLFVAVISFSATNSEAAIHLMSAPLPAGENGFVCGCLNLSNQPIYLEISIQIPGGGASTVRGPALIPTDLRYVDLTSTNTMAYCKATRFNSDFSKVLTVTTKKLSCTFSTVETNTSPKAQVPVVTRVKSSGGSTNYRFINNI